MHLKSILKYIIGLATVGILALPLYVDGSTLFPYVLSKIIVFQMLVEVCVASYGILQFLDRSYRVDWRNNLIRAQILWIVLLSLSSFISVDGYRSWWSTAQWMTGTITYLHFFAWFLVLASVFKTGKDWRLFFWTSVVVSFLTALYGLGQSLHIFWTHYDPTLGRIYSTLGNPIYFALYLLLNIFVAGFLIVQEKQIFTRIILGFFSATFAGTLFLTGTRSAVVTLLLSLVLFFVFLLLGKDSKKYRIVLLSFLGIFFAVVVGLFLWLQTAGGAAWSQAHISVGLQRVVYQTFQDPARVELSHIAFEGFARHPFFGWGPNNYPAIFSTYVRPQDYGTLFPSIWYDQAHNQVLNVLATGGIIGFLAYLLPWIVAWWLLWRRFTDEKSMRDRIGSSIVALFFFAYFLQNLTAFDTPGPLIMLYFMFAFVFHMTADQKRHVEPPTNDAPPLVMVMPPVVILLCLALITLNIIPYTKARTASIAIDTVMQDFDRGVGYFQKALSGPSFINDDVRHELAKAAISYGARYNFPDEKKKEFLNFAIIEMQKSVERHPLSLQYELSYFGLARSYQRYAPEILSQVEEQAKKMVDRYPSRRDVLLIFAFIEMDLKKFETAKEYAMKIVALDPTRADAYWWLAQVLASAGDSDGALKNIDHARALHYPIFADSAIYIQLASARSSDKYGHLNSLIVDAWSKDNLHTLDLATAAAITLTKLDYTATRKSVLAWIHEHDEGYARSVEEMLKGLKK